MTVEDMCKAAGMQHGGECPSAALHEDDGTKWIAIDDVTGKELDPELMRKARRDEIAYSREMGVYEKVDIAESWKETGRAPIAVRWIDINKGDSASPNYRSRLVAKEFNTGSCPELYAATPPSECLRLMLSRLASTRKQGTGLMYADVSRAYFYAKAAMKAGEWAKMLLLEKFWLGVMIFVLFPFCFVVGLIAAFASIAESWSGVGFPFQCVVASQL